MDTTACIGVLGLGCLSLTWCVWSSSPYCNVSLVDDVIFTWCEALSSGVGHQGAQREESGGPTPKGGKIEVFDIFRYKKRTNLEKSNFRIVD